MTVGQSKEKCCIFFFYLNLTKTNKFSFKAKTFDLRRRWGSCRRCRRYGKDRCSVRILKRCRIRCWRGRGVAFPKHHPVRRRRESFHRRYGKECFPAQILKQCRRRCLCSSGPKCPQHGGERDEESTHVLCHAKQVQTTKLSDFVTTALLRRSDIQVAKENCRFCVTVIA